MRSPNRKIPVFVLAMLNLSVVMGLRGLPFSAQYGFSSAFFYILAALIFMIPYALVSAELASGWPQGGGVYIWVREALGETWGFVAAWMQWFHNIAIFPAMIAFTAAAVGYLIFPEMIHNKLFVTFFTLGVFWSITLYNFLGITSSSLFSTVCVIMGTIIPAVLLSCLAMSWLFQGKPIHIDMQWSSFFPTLTTRQNIAFLANVFLTLTGLEVNANLAHEIDHPRKNFPKAIFLATGVALLLYIFGSLALALVLNMDHITYLTGILDAGRTLLNDAHLLFFLPVLVLFLIFGSLGQINTWVIASIKGLFFTTKYGILPPVFHRVNRKNVPTTLLLVQAILVSIATLLFLLLPNINASFWILTLFGAQTYIIVYILLFIAGIVLKYKKPNTPRSYEIPGKKWGMWLMGGIGFLSSCFVLLIGFLPPQNISILNEFLYIVITFSIFLVLVALPIVISLCKKPYWKNPSLQEKHLEHTIK